MRINVFISDNDSFFTQGLKYALIRYFEDKNIGIDFNEFFNPDSHYCMAFIGVGQFSHYREVKEMINADTVFIIQPIGDWNGMRINSLQRHQSLNAFFSQLDEAVCFTSEVPLHRVPTTPLTLREKAVLAYYSFGYTNIKIGQLLGINQKTVSAHKVNAMKKLNITHKGDFRRWITAMAPFFPSTEKSDARILKRAP